MIANVARGFPGMVQTWRGATSKEEKAAKRHIVKNPGRDDVHEQRQHERPSADDILAAAQVR